VVHERFSPRYLAAMAAGFELSRQWNRPPGPVQFLVGITAIEGPAANALGEERAGALRDAAARSAIPELGPMSLHTQAQQGALAWATIRGERVEPEHLVVALLDQGSPDVREALGAAGVDTDTIRGPVLESLGERADMAPIPLPALSPAATLDRPALPIAGLPVDVWAQLCWRQEHLPLHRLHRSSDWHALSRVETQAGWRLAARARVDKEVRYSLVHHHDEAVQRRAFAVAPDVVAEPVLASDSGSSSGSGSGSGSAYGAAPRATMMIGHRRRRWLRTPNAFVGWGTWFQNRAGSMNAAWFRVSTLRSYRG
jgi:hypothetical protein